MSKYREYDQWFQIVIVRFGLIDKKQLFYSIDNSDVLGSFFVQHVHLSSNALWVCV